MGCILEHSLIQYSLVPVNMPEGDTPMKPELLHTTPEPIAPDTWLIPTLAADPAGGFVGAHSAVIRGAEPVVVDTSVLFGREQWLRNVFSVVEPGDVRWIFLSHDDHDHLGNLDVLLDLCPQAT